MKIVISCAITGSIHTPSMSPYLPFTAEDIAAQALDAAGVGAAILHLHARDPQTGKPSADPAHWQGFLPRISRKCDAVLNMTTGGSAVMTLDQRLAAPEAFAPEMCSLNMGTMNFALYPMARRRDWRFDWEEPFLTGSDDLVFKNTPRDIATVLARMGRHGTRFEFECYDLSHLYMLRHFVDRGLVGGPVFLQFVMGVLGGIAAEPEHLVHMQQTALRLFPDMQWSVLAAGRRQMEFAAMAAAMGGHVRVGLEDNLYISKGVLAKSNAEQVRKLRGIVEALGREVATAEEARALLGLRGRQVYP